MVQLVWIYGRTVGIGLLPELKQHRSLYFEVLRISPEEVPSADCEFGRSYKARIPSPSGQARLHLNLIELKQ